MKTIWSHGIIVGEAKDGLGAGARAMPRAFTEREREVIRSRLRAAARDTFRAHGLRRTNVEELARAAGISKSAF